MNGRGMPFPETRLLLEIEGLTPATVMRDELTEEGCWVFVMDENRKVFDENGSPRRNWHTWSSPEVGKTIYGSWSKEYDDAY